MQTRAKAMFEPLKDSQTWRIFAYPVPPTPSDMDGTRLSDHGQPAVLDADAYAYAINLYSAYFYRSFAQLAPMVDCNALDEKWKPLGEINQAEREANKNHHGLVLRSDACNTPAIWTMAIIISALHAWLALSRTRTRDANEYVVKILTEVFRRTEGSNLDTQSFTSGGSRRKRLLSDISFWRLYARDRGLDTAMRSVFSQSVILSNAAEESCSTAFQLEESQWVNLLSKVLSVTDI
jgi:hypothetical protein